MFEQLSVLVEPFERVALDTVGVWYLGTVAAMTVVAVVMNYGLGIGSSDPFPDGVGYWGKVWTACMAAPVVEETAFRILPVELGFSLGTIVLISVVWALLHDTSAVAVGMSIPVYLKLVLGGFFIEAIMLHSFHNLWVTTIAHVWGDDEDESDE